MIVFFFLSSFLFILCLDVVSNALRAFLFTISDQDDDEPRD